MPRTVYWGSSEKSDAIAEAAVALLRQLGAEIIDPADIPTAEAMLEEPGEMEVLLYEFKHDLNAYLAERGDPAIRSLEDLIRFNEEHAEEELRYFGQEHFLQAQEKGPLTDPVYLDALARNHRLSRQEGIDAVMEQYQLDALVTPTQGPPWAIDLVDGDHRFGTDEFHPGGARRLPHRQCSRRLYLRATGRHQLPRATVQRANPDPAGVRVRAGGMRPSAATLPLRWHRRAANGTGCDGFQLTRRLASASWAAPLPSHVLAAGKLVAAVRDIGQFVFAASLGPQHETDPGVRRARVGSTRRS